MTKRGTPSAKKAVGRVTSAAVAQLAQVSQSAVSRTFTPGASVAPETKDRVLAAARELGYRPNAIARSLISGRSRIIGLIVAYLDNQFYPQMMEGLAKALQERGYHTLLFMAESGDQDHQLERLLSYQVDGVVMASATLSSALAHECLNAGIPVVLFNRELSDSVASSVVSDNEQGGRLVAEHFIKAQHQRIAFIAGDEDSSTNRGREAGFYRVIRDSTQGLFAREVGGYSTDGAITAAHRLMRRDKPPDAIFVANDHMAFAVLDQLRYELGLRVPGDVSVIGFDDVPQAAWKAYHLTTVRQPLQLMIDATVGILFDQIESGKAESTRLCLPVQLIERETCKSMT